jgi:hypothetical protein
MNEGSESSRISVDWPRLKECLFRLVTGLGLITCFLFLTGVTVLLLIWLGTAIAKLSFAWLLGLGASIPLLAFVWYLCFYVALDGLSDFGIHLDGAWRWLILPIAPLVAPLSFVFVYLSGVGRFVTKPRAVYWAFAFGAVFILSLLAIALL